MDRIIIRYFFIFISLFPYFGFSFGSGIILDPKSFQFSKITQKEGLSHNNVECTIKDSDGFMWFGTRNGLCRFDGYQINTFYSTENTNSISGNRILCIEEDSQGYLWIGTYNNGLNRYNKYTEEFTHYGNDYLIGDRINKIKVLSDNTIWICTTNGLARYNPESDDFKIYMNEPDNPRSLNSNIVYDIYETRDHNIYIATEGTMIQEFNRDTETFTSIQYKRDPELNTNYRKQIIEDFDGILWISANVHGLCSYNPSNGESVIHTMGEGGLSTNVLMGNMALDPEGNIWICSDGGGVNIFTPSTRKFQYLQKGDEDGSLSSNHIYSVYFDNQNIIWIGTFDEGINFYDPNRFKFRPTLYSPNDLSFFSRKSIISLFQDSKRRIWVGTDGDGLYRIDTDGKIAEYHHDFINSNSLSTEVITSINEDKNGNILLGTYSAGFLVLDVSKNRFTRFFQGDYNQGFLGSNSIWCIYPDSKERIWLGLLGSGVDLYNPIDNTFINFGPNSESPQKIDFPNVMAIIEDSDGDIWYGTEGSGLFILDNETNKILQLIPDSNRTVTTQGIIKCIYQDRWEQIWIGTEGAGIFRFNKKSKELIQFTQNNGLPGDIIQSIIEDAIGNLWIGTSHGLSNFAPNTQKFTNYIESDGLSGDEFNQNVFLKLHDGRLMAGTTNGLDIFHPEDIALNQNLPRVVITNLQILNKTILPGMEVNNRKILERSITFTDEITLTHKEKAITFEFAALNYTLPEKCVFEYMLEEFDVNWIQTGSTLRQASYSNLKAGSYTFKVRASNNDGKWGNNEVKINLRILPPFYKTYWFRGIFFAFIVLLIFLIYRNRLNMHKSHFLNKQLEQESKIMHLENEKLEYELKQLTFHILNRNRALIDQKNRLIGLSMKAKESVRTGLQDIISKFDQELSDEKDWKHIEPQLDKVYNNFVSRLKEKHPELTLSEIKIAAYVRMNLSTKEMSEFMHKTTRAIENDRYRLRKKIGLEQNDSLQNYLINL